MAKEQKQLLIVGYVAEAIPDLEKYLKPPVPPKNYGPEAAEKWLKEKGPERLAEAKLVAASGKLTGRALRKAFGRRATVVAVLVMQNDPTETRTKYADYRLVVNGVLPDEASPSSSGRSP